MSAHADPPGTRAAPGGLDSPANFDEPLAGRSGQGTTARLVLAVLFAVVLLPIAYVVYGSLRTGAPGDPSAVFTLRNWTTALSSPAYLTALANTVILGLLVSPLSVIVGAALAWIIARTDAPWRRQLALLVLLPMMISNLITTLSWIALAAPNAGFVNAYARAWFGVRTLFNIYSVAGIVLVDVLHYASFAFLALYAALQSIDASLEEASFMQGVGPIGTGVRMTLPLIAPTLATTLLVIFVFVAENFSVPTLLGAPVGFQTLPSIIYLDMSLSPAEPNLAAAAGLLLLLVAALGAFWQRRIARRAARYVTLGGKGSRRRLTRLGIWRLPAAAIVLLFVFMAVLLPYLILVLGSFLSFMTPRLRPGLFTLDNYRALFSSENLTPTINSLLFSVFGGLGATALYVLISQILKRLPARWGRAVDYVTIVPTALPALVLAVGLLWAFVGLPLPIYGTAAILLIAYFIRYVGYGLRHASDAFGRISSELTEAARLCGASQARASWDVAIPLARPAILSLWTVLFIYIFMEISATILLYSPASRTLPTVLWNDMGSGSQPRAFAIAVAQATLTFLVLIFTDRRYGTLRGSLET